MKLIIEPDQGAAPILNAINKAQKSIEVTIFRFDRKDVEAALKAAVARGVKVTALIAYANRGGQRLLRELEMRFLDAGVIVARTADDLTRYHDKVMIIDRRTLYVLSFNFTHLDIAHSRGFGISTEQNELVEEAVKLFESDCTRTAYTAGLPALVVSPVNSRKEIGSFIRRARKQLLIYDPEISDKEMIRIMKERAKAGVEIRIIGHINKRENLEATDLNRMRLHTRTIIRDRHQAFVGSQSLRAMELDRRREVGIVIRESRIVKSLAETFESDWTVTELGQGKEAVGNNGTGVPKKEIEKVTQALVRELYPVTATVKRAVKKVVAKAGDEALHDETVKRAMKKIVKRAVKDAVRDATKEVANA